MTLRQFNDSPDLFDRRFFPFIIQRLAANRRDIHCIGAAIDCRGCADKLFFGGDGEKMKT